MSSAARRRCHAPGVRRFVAANDYDTTTNSVLTSRHGGAILLLTLGKGWFFRMDEPRRAAEARSPAQTAPFSAEPRGGGVNSDVMLVAKGSMRQARAHFDGRRSGVWPTLRGAAHLDFRLSKLPQRLNCRISFDCSG